MSTKPDVRYADPSHRDHNDRLEQARQSKPRDVTGPWLSRPPELRRAFDANRDPLIARRMADPGKTKHQRRESSAADEYRTPRKTDKPAPALKPQHPLRGDADREGWLVAQRDAAFAHAAAREAAKESAPEQTLTPTRATQGPSL